MRETYLRAPNATRIITIKHPPLTKAIVNELESLEDVSAVVMELLVTQNLRLCAVCNIPSVHVAALSGRSESNAARAWMALKTVELTVKSVMSLSAIYNSCKLSTLKTTVGKTEMLLFVRFKTSTAQNWLEQEWAMDEPTYAAVKWFDDISRYRTLSSPAKKS